LKELRKTREKEAQIFFQTETRRQGAEISADAHQPPAENLREHLHFAHLARQAEARVRKAQAYFAKTPALGEWRTPAQQTPHQTRKNYFAVHSGRTKPTRIKLKKS